MIYIESDCVLYAGHNSTSVAEVVLGFVFLSRIVCQVVLGFVCSSSCHGLFAQVVLGFVYSFSCYGLFVYIDNWVKDSAYKHSSLLCILNLFVLKVYIALHDVTFEQEIELTSTMYYSLTTIWGRKCEASQGISLEYKVLWGKIIKRIVLWS